MSKRNLQKERLDRIGRNLLEAARVRSEEIEKIVAAPKLFDSVKARIKDEQSRRKPRRFFGDWASFSVWNWQKAAVSLAILVILTGAAVFIFRKDDSPQVVKEDNKPQIESPIKQPENSLPPQTPEIKKDKSAAVENRIKPERTAFKNETAKLPNQARKNPVKSLPKAKKEAERVFYSLMSAGNWEANGEDLQIVRTELSRSELFALGINLPMENETPKIKTDLLIGSDGVARAIRFVE
jgi:hypothetical protein